MLGKFLGTFNPVTNRSVATLVACLVATVCCEAVCCQVALGQLRSGRVSRELYADQQTDSRSSTAQAQSVVPASYSNSSSDDQIALASCDSCDAGGHMVDHGTINHFTHDHSTHSHSSCGCGSSACSDCCDAGFYDLAPGASMRSFGGRGPLMSLWCRLAVRAEVPLYWRRSANPPPLVTTSPDGTPSGTAGQLPAGDTTSILLGGSPLNSEANAGFRLTLSTWLGNNKKYGLMFRYWTAGDQDDTFNFSSATHPILARPFFDTSVLGSEQQSSQLIAFTGQSTGSIAVATTSQVQGVDLGIRRLLYQDRFTRVDWLWGYKNMSVEEGLTIRSNTSVFGNQNPLLTGSQIDVIDDFRTENDFNGVSYGIMSTRHFARWKMESMFRLGAGNLRRRVNIAGSTTTTSGAGAVNQTSEGLLARATNRQPFEDDTFVVVPEVAFSLAYAIRPGLDFNVGYHYMMLPKVAQASQQINDDLAVNLSDPLTGSLDPQLNFDERRYWVQSLGLGLQWRY